jgi:hypothetical protein
VGGVNECIVVEEVWYRPFRSRDVFPSRGGGVLAGGVWGDSVCGL